MRASKVVKRSKYYIYPVYAHKNLFNDTNSLKLELDNQNLQKETARITKEAAKIGVGIVIQGLGNRIPNYKLAASGVHTQEEGQELLRERNKGHYFDRDWLQDKSPNKQSTLEIKSTDVIWNEYVRINAEKFNASKGNYPHLSKQFNKYVKMQPYTYNARAKESIAHHVTGTGSTFGYRLCYVVSKESPEDLEKTGSITKGTVFRHQEDAETFAKRRGKSGHLLADRYLENMHACSDVRHYTEEDTSRTQPSRLFEPSKKITRFEEEMDNDTLLILKTALEEFFLEKKKNISITLYSDRSKDLRILEVKGEIPKEFFLRHQLSDSFFIPREAKFSSQVILDHQLAETVESIEQGIDEVERMLTEDENAIEIEMVKPVKHK